MYHACHITCMSVCVACLAPLYVLFAVPFLSCVSCSCVVLVDSHETTHMTDTPHSRHPHSSHHPQNTMTVTPHMTHLHIFLLLVSSSVAHALDTSLIFITPLSCYSGISHFVLLLSLSLIESCCCCVSRLFSTIVRVSALLLLSSPLIFFSFICCPWGARRWGNQGQNR